MPRPPRACAAVHNLTIAIIVMLHIQFAHSPKRQFAKYNHQVLLPAKLWRAAKQIRAVMIIIIETLTAAAACRNWMPWNASHAARRLRVRANFNVKLSPWRCISCGLWTKPSHVANIWCRFWTVWFTHLIITCEKWAFANCNGALMHYLLIWSRSWARASCEFHFLHELPSHASESR